MGKKYLVLIIGFIFLIGCSDTCEKEIIEHNNVTSFVYFDIKPHSTNQYLKEFFDPPIQDVKDVNLIYSVSGIDCYKEICLPVKDKDDIICKFEKSICLKESTESKISGIEIDYFPVMDRLVVWNSLDYDVSLKIEIRGNYKEIICKK